MAFSRKFLMDNGVPEDKVDVIMAERNRTLTDYVPKADVQAQIGACLLYTSAWRQEIMKSGWSRMA